MFLGQEVHYYMVCIAYFTELNLQICDYAQKQRICRENCKHALDERFHGHFCPRRKPAKSCHPVARYDTRVEPNEKFLHGRDAKGRYLTLTPKYADMVKIIIMTTTMVLINLIMMVRKIMAVILMITIMTSLPALDP